MNMDRLDVQKSSGQKSPGNKSCFQFGKLGHTKKNCQSKKSSESTVNTKSEKFTMIAES